MKKFTLFFALFFCVMIHVIAQQIPLKGIVTVQNSKTYTGKMQYVKNAEITHSNAKNDVTDDDGKFTLNITGLNQNIQTQIAVVPHGEYSDYVVVNEKELQNITLGRVTPVGVYICKKGELEQRQAEMVGINMRKLEERMDNDKKRLQKELEELKTKNDYLNARYGEIKDSLDIISKNIDNAFERIKEFAQSMVLENLDIKEDNYIKAYECFSRGELDSVSYYLQEQELELKHQKIMQMQEEAKKEKELAAILTESAKAKEEFSENSLNELIKEWLLLARTYGMKNDYEKTMLYYEKAIQVDSLNTDNKVEYAKYLFSIREYKKAESNYLQCLEIFRALEQENPKAYLSNIAYTLARLANLHRVTIEYQKSLEEHEEALEICRKLAIEDPKKYLDNVARMLNNMGILHRAINEESKALAKYNEALEIYRSFPKEEIATYREDLANTLNNLGVIYYDFKEYQNALEKYEEAIKIFETLVSENPKVYLADIALSLHNMAVIHVELTENEKALEKYEGALDIYRKLVGENPKVYLPDIGGTLINLANLHSALQEDPKALEEYEEALEIFRKLATDNPKVYLVDLALILNNIAVFHDKLEEYTKSLIEFDEALEIYRKLAEEYPNIFLPFVATVLQSIADTYNIITEYRKSLKVSEEAVEIYRNLVEKDQTYLSKLEVALSNLSWYSLFSKEYAQSERAAREVIEFGNTYFSPKINLAHALLLQNRFTEAEKIYKELSQTIYQENETYSQVLLDDLEALEQAGAIPEERKEDVEKIRKIMNP